jgi:O-antigen/teichoic acid export membrane protein
MSNSKTNYFYNLALTLINLLFPIISFPYASRILGPYGIGKVQFIVTFAQYFALIAALGIPVYGIREIAKVRHDPDRLSQTFSELMVIYLASSFVLGSCYLLIIYLIPGFAQDRLFYLTASMIVFIGFSTIDWFYAGIEEFKIIAIRSTVIKVIAIILLFVFVKTPNDLFLYLLITLSTLLGNNLINIVAIWKKVKLVTKGLNLKIHRRPLLLVFSTTLASSMYTLFDVLMLGFLADEKAVGFYTAGVKITKVCIPLVTSLGIVLMPKIAAKIHNKSMDEFFSLIAKSYAFVVLISVPIGFGLYLLSREFILLFSGPQFLDSVGSMQILSVLPFIIGMGYLLGIQILTTSSKDKEMLICVCFGMAASLLLNVLLIPHYRQEGASVANVLSEVVVTCCYYYFVKIHYNIKFQLKPMLQALLSSLIFIPVVLLFRQLLPEAHFLILLLSVGTNVLLYLVIQSFVFKNELILEIYGEVMQRIRPLKN